MKTLSSPGPVYEFGEFALDPSAQRFSRSGDVVTLTPRVFDTLRYLVENHGRLLEKDELLAAVWPGISVEENNLGQAISRIRAALGESPGDNRYIVTVPGRGYRFVADVRVSTTADPIPVTPEPTSSAPAPRPRRTVFVAAALALVAGALIYAYASLGNESRRRDSADPKANELYQRGRFFMSLAQPQNAIPMFEQAAERDRNFALPLAGLADILSRVPIATDGPSAGPGERARAAALRALAIDPELADAHAAMGWIGFYFDWDWTHSERSFERALALNADDVSARLGYAHLLANTGRLEEALTQIDRALQLDPLSPIAGSLKAQFLYNAGRRSEAHAIADDILVRSPGFWIARLQAGSSQLQAGRPDEAIASFQAARQNGGTWTPLAMIGYTHAVSGQTAQARRVLDELITAQQSSYVPPYRIATVFAGLGDGDAAIQWLERGIEERDVRMVFLKVDPVWKGLQQEPRFIDLLRRMHLEPSGEGPRP